MEQAPVIVPAIPVPRPDLTALTATCVALKQQVERMMRAPSPMGSARRPVMFLQPTQPTKFADGDFWLHSAETTTLSVALGGNWRIVGNLV
jgi:hypothetical protein